MIIQGCYSEVEFRGEGMAPYFTSDEARSLARRLTDAADRADGRCPDGIYRVSAPRWHKDSVIYRRVVNGEPLDAYGRPPEPGDQFDIHERIGDIP